MGESVFGLGAWSRSTRRLLARAAGSAEAAGVAKCGSAAAGAGAAASTAISSGGSLKATRVLAEALRAAPLSSPPRLAMIEVS